MKLKSIFICLFLLVISLWGAEAAEVDSVGIKVIDGEKYIIHKLEPKETLYSLGKRYHVSVAEIREVNPQEKNGYRIDQIGRELIIPFKEDQYLSSTLNSAANSDAKQHKVKAGETIYSISKKYNISQKDIMKWNNLTTSALDIGQELWVSSPTNANANNKKQDVPTESLEEGKTHVVDLGETIYSISKQYGVTQSKIIELNGLEDNNIAVGQKLIIEATSKEEPKLKSEEPKNQYQTPSVQTFHNAKKGENYKEIAQMYGLEESKLKKWNSFEEPFVGGEVIKIAPPEVETEKAADIEKDTKSPEKADGPRLHTVKSGETLYSLSEKYGVEVEDLRSWNSLNNYQLSLGQQLYVRNPDALMTDDENQDDTGDDKPLFESSKQKISENPQKQDTKAYFTVEEDEIPKIEKIKEKGVAEVIEGSEGTEKYLALHRTAKIGTIMQVRNDLNDQIVFVRVLGKLPNTGVDEKVVIRISKKAFEKLGGVDYKFPVEISYLPLKD